MKLLKKFVRAYWLWLAIILVAGLVAGAFFLGRYLVYRSHPELNQADQAIVMLQKVGKLIALPTGETPTMATITDAKSVKTAQPFLAKAQNGDVLIVYQTAAEALLYRPSTNQLIAVGPVNTAPQEQTTPVQKEVVPVPVVTATSTHATSTTDKN